MTARNQGPNHAVWSDFRISSFSGGGGCVEIAISSHGDVRVRDSKLEESPELSFNRREWEAFLAGVRNREFELPPVAEDQ